MKDVIGLARTVAECRRTLLLCELGIARPSSRSADKNPFPRELVDYALLRAQENDRNVIKRELASSALSKALEDYKEATKGLSVDELKELIDSLDSADGQKEPGSIEERRELIDSFVKRP